jgi:predicted transcriptional regulator
MRLEPELKDWLEHEAKRQDRSVAYIAKQAIQSLKIRTEAKTRMIQEALDDADQGVFISSEKMHTWMESWGSDNELPAPEPDIHPK